MSTENIKRCYYFRTENYEEPTEAVQDGFNWIKETGGTIITNVQDTFYGSFNLSGQSGYQKFEQVCLRSNIWLKTIRGQSFSPKGKRTLLLFLDRKGLVQFEQNINEGHFDSSLEQILLLVWNEGEVQDWVWRYNAELLGKAPDGWKERIDSFKTVQPVPKDIDGILAYLAEKAKGYNCSLQNQEINRLKADLMQNWSKWEDLSERQIKGKCFELKMSLRDVDTIVDLFQKRKQGHKLIPNKGSHGFNHVLS